ncbi:sigma factor-like helix-turn-helix DNA-binding protein [Streptomyces sp. NPDC002589]|uniref:sigma factor-like helix-turn-helix DNA-binding protein n=1 Tax=Streptomyces sp. NPDC002589 TaxID=3154420 RepID=UPI003334A65E
MRDRQVSRGTRRAREFEAFVAGAAGRLLHAATLLTAEAPDANPRARRLLAHALAHTYARWDRLHGEDPYDCARQYLATRFARATWHQYVHQYLHPYVAFGRARPDPRSPLAALTPQERLILVLRLYEGVAEEQTAALLGLPTERIHTMCDRATATLLHPARPTAPRTAGPKVAPS